MMSESTQMFRGNNWLRRGLVSPRFLRDYRPCQILLSGQRSDDRIARAVMHLVNRHKFPRCHSRSKCGKWKRETLRNPSGFLHRIAISYMHQIPEMRTPSQPEQPVLWLAGCMRAKDAMKTC